MVLESTVQTESDAPDGDVTIPAIKLENLTELLEDKPVDKTPDGDDDGAASGDTDKKAKPEMFNDLADSLGLKLEDLYKLKVTSNDGKTVTIEELKALQGTQDDLTIRELEFEESRVTKESGLRQAQSELAEIVAALPDGTLSPVVLEKLRTKNAARVQVEQARTIEAIPGWESEGTRTKDMAGMITHLEGYGFPKAYLAAVTDHRQIVFIRESYLREQRIQKALAKVRVGKPNPTTTTKTTGKAPGKTSAKPADSDMRNGLESFLLNA